METTWSLSSRLPTSIFSAITLIWLTRSFASLELQPRLARGVGEGLDAAVVLEAAAVEHHLLDALLLRAARDQPAHFLRGRHVAAALELALHVLVARGRGDERLARVVVDHLRVDVGPAAVHREPRPLFAAADLLADALVQPLPDLLFRSHAHLIAPAGVPGSRRAPGVPAAPLLGSRRPGLAGLLLELLADVADPLLLVGVRTAQPADLGRDLSHLLAVDARDGHARLLVDR